MGFYKGPLFGDQNKGYKAYGFETKDVDIVFTINTQIVTAGDKTFSLITFGTCSYIVYWGDGTSETVNASGTFTKTRTYDTAGIYNVNIKIISGVFRPYYNNNAVSNLILKIRGKYNTVFSGSFEDAFYVALNLQEFTVDLTGVTSLIDAFYRCPSLTYFNNNPASIVMKRPLFNFRDLSNVTNITRAFIGTGSISFNGFNLSGLSGSQTSGINVGVFGNNIYPSQVVSIGTETEPIVFGTTGGNTFGLQYFACYCPSLTQVCFDSGVKITGSFRQAFYRCASLRIFDVIDKNLINVTNIQDAFIGTGSLELKGLRFEGLSGSQTSGINVGVFGNNIYPSQVVSIGTETEPIVFGTTGGNTFGLQYFACYCPSLTQVCFDSGVKITTLYQAFYRCASLGIFDVIDKNLINVTNIQDAFIGTGSLELKGLRFEGLSGSQQSGTTSGVFGNNFYPSQVVSIGTETEPIVFGATGGNTFSLGNFAYLCPSLTQVYFDSGVKITGLYRAFYRCPSLDFFDVIDKDLSNVTNIQGAFVGTGSITFDGFNLSSLTSTVLSTTEGVFGSNIFPSKVTSIGTASEPIVFGTTGGNTFGIRLFAYACSFLTQVHFDSGVKITDWYRAFYNCSSLTTFRNLDVATGFTKVTSMTEAFRGCALDSASIENILVSCDNGGKTGIALGINGGTNARYSTWTPAAQTALANLQAKSWTITYNT